MSASDAYDRAEDLYKDENYAAAAAAYDEAVRLAPNNARYLANRAQNALKLRRYADALADARAALSIDSSNGRAKFREGLALFYLDRFEEAEKALTQAANMGQEKTEIWIRKCKAELERLAAGPSVVATSAPAAVVHRVDQLPPVPKENAKPQAAAVATPVVPKPPANLAERTREQWFQGPSDVTVTLLAKGLQPQQVDIQLDNNELKATLQFPADGSTYTRHWKLWGQVTSHSVSITPYKVEVVLQKAGEGGTTWDALERKEGEAVAPIVKRENVLRDDVNYAAYPTSAKTVKNWQEVEQSAKKAEEEEKPDGEAALQKLFQTIYKDADEDTRRAMIKSFQTSGGTVLSTNWKEVAEKDYTKEREFGAPKGQEMVDWNSKNKGAL